ncbi:APC family permease [Planctomycetota bacterium]
MVEQQTATTLRREIGVFGAMMMGMGSIVGTGVFVSIGIAADVAGNGVILAIALASLVAICNGLSSAQLAANHPVSGGTYEYGYRWLSPSTGFVAGWLFVCAKSASAATAALGFAGYLLHLIDADPKWIVPVALTAVAVLTAVVLLGIRRSNIANIVIVSVTLLALTLFVFAGLPGAMSNGSQQILLPWNALDGEPISARAILEATALMFVAYTGYGRIATLGEEVKDPAHTIPRAIIVTLIVSMVLYLAVAIIAVANVGAESYAAATRTDVAPLVVIANGFSAPGIGMGLAIGAVTAMLGVLLNLILGLSRVLLAMGRRSDVPTGFAALSKNTNIPWAATLGVATIIGSLVLVGDIRITWSFSAFAVLIYYALTNLCALRLQPDQRIFPIWPAYGGLAACGFLAFWVERQIWLAGLGLIGVGFVIRFASKRFVAGGKTRH